MVGRRDQDIELDDQNEWGSRLEGPNGLPLLLVSMGRVQACEIRKSTWVSLG